MVISKVVLESELQCCASPRGRLTLARAAMLAQYGNAGERPWGPCSVRDGAFGHSRAGGQFWSFTFRNLPEPFPLSAADLRQRGQGHRAGCVLRRHRLRRDPGAILQGVGGRAEEGRGWAGVEGGGGKGRRKGCGPGGRNSAVNKFSQRGRRIPCVAASRRFQALHPHIRWKLLSLCRRARLGMRLAVLGSVRRQPCLWRSL